MRRLVWFQVATLKPVCLASPAAGWSVVQLDEVTVGAVVETHLPEDDLDVPVGAG